MSKEYDFDVIHEVADEYFQRHVAENRSFTHQSGSKNGKNMFAIFYLYFNTNDTVDFHREMNLLNKILSDFDYTGARKKTSVFKVCEAEKWAQHDISCEFLFEPVCF